MEPWLQGGYNLRFDKKNQEGGERRGHTKLGEPF